MSRRGLTDVLLGIGLLCFACTASAQSTGPNGLGPGCWYQGKWISYLQLSSAGARQAGPAAPQARQPRQRIAQSQRVPPGQQPIVPASFEEAAMPGGEEIIPPGEEVVPPDDAVLPGGDMAYTVEGGPLPPASPGCCDAGPQVCCETSCAGHNWLWGEAEYLGWWTQGMHVPPLVTTSPAGTAEAQAGVLGQTGTTVLFGDNGLNSDGRSGGRFTLGAKFDPCGYSGVETTYMLLGDATDGFTASNADLTILARPFFNVETSAQDSRLIVFPDLLDGSVSVAATTEFQGVELLYRRAASRSCWSSVDFLVGYRWLQLKDDLLIHEHTLVLSGAAAGSTIDLGDRFATDNNFHGAEFGIDVRRQLFPLWSLDLLGKLAIGNTHSEARVGGSTTTTTAAAEVSTNAGGLLTQPSNIGAYEQDKFASVAEIGVTLRRRLSCRLEASFGYTFVYWSEVARAGDQVDLDVNLSQVPPGPLVGAARPGFAFTSTDFWAQGLNFGVEYSF